MFLQISGKRQYFTLVIKKFCKFFCFVQNKLKMLCLINATPTLSLTRTRTLPHQYYLLYTPIKNESSIPF